MKRKGFTLIELLVVVAVISLLASIVVTALNTARAESRDTRRKSDLHQIYNAMELYVNDNGQTPPLNYGGSWQVIANDACTGLGNYLVPKYMSSIPDDPKSPGPPPCNSPTDGFWYYYAQKYAMSGKNIIWGGNTSFIICSKLENISDPEYQVISGLWGSVVVNYCVGS
jgi:prepilin-type N-terminal cleavage/methylation domain-containing protein